MDLFLDIVADAAGDTLDLVPFLMMTYLLLEGLEWVAGDRVNRTIKRAGAAGPIVGALLGLVPQCGFSAVGATLYSGRVVTLGTLIAVFLSTSDEMLPLLVAGQVEFGLALEILVIKFIVALVAGLAVDAAMKALRANPRAHALVRRGVFGTSAGGKRTKGAGEEEAAGAGDAAEDSAGPDLIDTVAEAGEGADHIHELCEREHCGCDGEAVSKHVSEDVDASDPAPRLLAIIYGAFWHTLKVTVFIFLVTLALVAVLELGGEDVLASFLSGNELLSIFGAALVGIIPNCAASVVITQLYLEGMLSFAPMMAGLLMSAGTGLLVLFRTNQSQRENVAIVLVLYVVSVVSGLILLLLGF